MDISQNRGRASTLFSAFLFGLNAIPSTEQRYNLLLSGFDGHTVFFFFSLASILKLQVFVKGHFGVVFILRCSSQFEILPDSGLSDDSNNTSSTFGEILRVCSINIVDGD